MPTLEEVHLGLGSGEVTFDYDPQLLDELADFRHLLFYRQGKLLGTTVILSKSPSEEGITVSGYGLGFWLGIDNDGPVIESREYIAGNNMLPNGGFEIRGVDGQPIDWDRSELTGWSIYGFDSHSGDFSMRSAGGLRKDDFIKSESRPVPVGALLRLEMWAKRGSGDIGKLRLRTVYEGRYDHPDLLPALATGWTDLDIDDNPDNAAIVGTTVRMGPIAQPDFLEGHGFTAWTNTSEFSGDVVVVDDDSIIIGPCTQPQYILNPGFEGGTGGDGQPADWYGTTGLGEWYPADYSAVPESPPHGGNHVVEGFSGGDGMPSEIYLDADCAATSSGSATPVSVAAGEKYVYDGSIREGPGVGDNMGKASLTLLVAKTDGTLDYQNSTDLEGGNFGSVPQTGSWKYFRLDYDARAGDLWVTPRITVTYSPDEFGFFQGTFDFDDVALTRVEGNTARIESPAIAITPKEDYRLVADIIGSWSATTSRMGTLVISALLAGSGKPDKLVSSDELDVSKSSARTALEVKFTPDDGYDHAKVMVVATDLEGGNATVELPKLIRLTGNQAQVQSDPVAVVPEKSYKALVPVQPLAGNTQGEVKFSVLLQGALRDDQIIESSAVSYKPRGRKLLDFSFTPPSGYDTATVSVVGVDILGAAFTVLEKPTLELEDTSTSIFETKTGSNIVGWGKYAIESTAPAGMEKVHVEVIAEKDGDGWFVDDVKLNRRETVTTAAAIVDDLLRDPDTNDYLVNPGTIHPLGDSGYDWQISHLTNRAALLQFLRGGRLSPAREFRLNPDNTLDVGSAEQLFTERTAFKFVNEDLLLLSKAENRATVEDALTRVKVIGQALQQKAPKPDRILTGEASTTIPGAYDWNGNPVRRTRIIEDSAIDYKDYANARAQDELDRSTDSGQNITLGISEWSAWGEFEVGDWVFVYKPEALLQDKSNPMSHEGGTIFPVRKRVLSRKLTMARGDGFEIKIRRRDGSLFDATRFVNGHWDEKTSAKLELGEVRRDFANDPQGPAAGVQFARYRAQQAR